MIRVLAAPNLARRDSQVANRAPISRGATSRPSGEPSATVTICNSAWPTVASGIEASCDFTACLMLTRGRPTA